ncbi:MAG: tetratricopeptide repeat protein [Akkermansiaceae bacterium]
MADSDALFEKLQDAEDRDQLATARVLYEEILAREPEEGSLLILYAANLIELGDLATAEQILARAEELSAEKTQPGLLTQFGNLARARGQFLVAEKYFREAHQLSPDDAENLLNAAAMATGQGELSKAEYLLREAEKLRGELHLDSLYHLAGNLVSQQRYQDARSFFESILALDPGHELAKEWLEDLALRSALSKQLCE